MVKKIIIGTICVISMMMNDVNGQNRCPRACKKLIGNGNCDDQCNIEACNFDDGDCAEYEYSYEYGYEETEAPTNRPTRPTRKPVKTPSRPTAKPVNTPTLKPVSGPTLPPTVNTGSYNIEIVFNNPQGMSAAVQTAFNEAKARWETIVVGDIPSTYKYAKGSVCSGESFTKLSADKIVDDLLIFADTPAIDGVNNILGQAGPCRVTTESNGKEYTRVGIMQFDSADVAAMDRSGTLKSVILHEMGHILGIGTLWEDYKLINRVSKNVATYKGAQGNIGLGEIGGSGSAQIETQGGSGTAYGHWDEETYNSELMTGYAESNGKMPLSKLTARSLADLGFTINPNAADSFTMAKQSTTLRGSAKKSSRENDMIRKPYVLDVSTPY